MLEMSASKVPGEEEGTPKGVLVENPQIPRIAAKVARTAPHNSGRPRPLITFLRTFSLRLLKNFRPCTFVIHRRQALLLDVDRVLHDLIQRGHDLCVCLVAALGDDEI